MRRSPIREQIQNTVMTVVWGLVLTSFELSRFDQPPDD